MTQPDLFDDLADARAARDKAMAEASAHAGQWMDIALAMIQMRIWGEMTGEGLRLELMRRGLPAPHHHNAWGALINTAIRRGLLVKTGQYSQMRTRKSHARATPVLRRA